jgi:hypothetical protein
MLNEVFLPLFNRDGQTTFVKEPAVWRDTVLRGPEVAIGISGGYSTRREFVVSIWLALCSWFHDSGTAEPKLITMPNFKSGLTFPVQI